MFKHLSIGTKNFKKGDVIIRQGDPMEYIYLLESGTCYRHMVTDKGDTIIYAIKKPGNTVSSLLGVLNLKDPAFPLLPVHPANASASR